MGLLQGPLTNDVPKGTFLGFVLRCWLICDVLLTFKIIYTSRRIGSINKTYEAKNIIQILTFAGKGKIHGNTIRSLPPPHAKTYQNCHLKGRPSVLTTEKLIKVLQLEV